jgi:hypothetical protein
MGRLDMREFLFIRLLEPIQFIYTVTYLAKRKLTHAARPRYVFLHDLEAFQVLLARSFCLSVRFRREDLFLEIALQAASICVPASRTSYHVSLQS